MNLAKKWHTFRTLNWSWAGRYYAKRIRIHWHLFLSKLFGRKYWTATIDGVDIKLGWTLPYQHEYAYNEARGRHERALLSRWKKEARQAKTIFDGGAYNGIYGLLAAAANPEAHVVIFEPNPSQAKNIEQNITLNGFRNIEFIPKALAGTSGVTRFTKDDGGSAGKVSGKGELEVGTTTLNAHGIPDLIKLDIVGAEYDALVAAKNMLAEKNVRILLELYPQNKEKLLSFLHSLGYRTEFLAPRADGGVEYYFVSKN